MLLGQARGRVGSVVFSRRNGKQVESALPSKVANPKTVLQQRQRTAFATAMQAASALRKIIDHSFEGTKYGQPSISRFVRENVKFLSSAITGNVANFNIKGVAAPQLNEYKISDGSLAGVNYSISTKGLGIFMDVEELAKLSATITTQAAYEECLQLLGCVPGDQLTIVQLDFGGSSNPKVIGTYGAADNYSVFAQIARVVFVKELPENFSGSFILGDSETINPALTTRLEGVFSAVKDNGDGALYLSATYPAPCACLIRSQQQSDGKWARSTERMLMVEGYEGYAEGAVVYPSYGATATENVGSDYILNNALSPNA